MSISSSPHRIKRALCFIAAGRQRFGQHARRDFLRKNAIPALPRNVWWISISIGWMSSWIVATTQVRVGGTKAPMCEPLIAAETLLRCKGYSHPLSNLRSAADTRSAGVAVVPNPPHG